MSAAGRVDRVELQGEWFEVQTELVDPGSGKIRTSIFRAGVVVAVNEATLRSVAALAHDPESLQEVVALHHQHVLDGFVGRTRSFAERLRSADPVDPVGPARAWAAASEVEVESEAEVPPLPEDPAVGDGVDIRRLFGEMRRRMTGSSEGGAACTPGEGDRRDRLRRAGEALAWATSQPRFTRARVDEQVRFHLLADRISSWERHGSNPEEADWIWTEVVAFCAYVGEISLRSELLDFDRRLVLWALRALERHGATRATLQPLEWLYGRDPELDDLLTRRPAVPAATWANQLRRMWHRIGPG